MELILNKKKLHTAIVTIITAGTLALSASANAGWIRSSQVTDTVEDNLDGTWEYNYTVFNTSIFLNNNFPPFQTPLIVDWELPYFADMGITDVFSPDGWDWAIETIGVSNSNTGWDGIAAWQNSSDPFYEGADSPYTTGTEVLHWYCDTADGGEGSFFCGGDGEGPFGQPISPNMSLSGFGFTANFEPTGAPYQASWLELPIQTGDPAFPLSGVGSPSALASTPVPEPGALALFGIGLLGLLGIRRKKHL